MFGLGALDDVLHFGATTKLVVQTIMAGVVVYLMPPAHITGIVVIDALLSLVWIVGITNAFNLLDNIDGLSAGIAVVAGVFLLAALSASGASPLTLAVAAFVGAALGIPRLQRAAGVDLHGGRRQPVPRIVSRQRGAAGRARRSRPASCRSPRSRSSSC